MTAQSDILTLPLAPEGDVDALAEWYAENEALLTELVRTVYRAKRHLEGRIKDEGPILTAHGMLDLEPKGYEWDASGVAAAVPALVKSRSATITGTPADVERALSLVSEDVPSITVTSDAWDIDKLAAARVIARGGPVAEQVEACRVKKSGKLELR